METAGTADPHFLLTRLRNRKVRKKVREAYRHLQDDHNNVSVVVWHGPFTKTGQVGIAAPNARLTSDTARLESSCMNDKKPGRGGTLLTGDISLRHDFPSFKRWLKGFMTQTSIVSLPHHGSVHSWNPALMLDLSFINSSRPLFVASAGADNSYGHPSREVVADIAAHARVAHISENDDELTMTFTADLRA